MTEAKVSQGAQIQREEREVEASQRALQMEIQRNEAEAGAKVEAGVYFSQS